MRAILTWGGGLLAGLLFTSVSFGQYYVTPVAKTPYRQAPDMTGPGFYYVDACGIVWGPNHCVYPPFPPFQGCLPGQAGKCIQAGQGGVPPWSPAYPMPPRPPQAPGFPPGANPGQQATGIYPTHPYIRGPRDYFMWNEVMEDRGRPARPNLVVP